MFVTLNLDYFSIIRLATLIMSLSITVYLFSIKGKSKPTILLACAFSGLTLFNLSMFIFHAEPYYWQPYNLKNLFQPFLMALGATMSAFSFILFSYHFPRFRENERREYRILVWFLALMNAGILLFALYNFVILQRMHGSFGMDLLYHRSLAGGVAFQYFLVIFLLVRRTERLSLGESASWWQAFFSPAGKDARAARALAIVLLLPCAGLVAFLLRLFGALSPVTMIYIVSYIFLLFYFCAIVVYLSNTEERTTFQGKLVFGALVVMLGIVGLVSIIVGRTYERDYRNQTPIPSPATIRFSPNRHQSYTIARVPFSLDTDKGIREKLEYGGRTSAKLAFAFPFYTRRYTKIHILSGPMIYLGEDIRADGWGGYNSQPAIAPLIMDLDPSRGGGVFLKNEPHRAVITWHRLPEHGRSSENTVQLVLYEDGRIDFSYLDVNPDPADRSVKVDVTAPAKITGSVLGTGEGKSIPFAPRLSGIHPGGRKVQLEPIRFSTDLPYVSDKPSVIFESYESEYYRYLHDHMRPFAVVLAASSIFILFFFPLLFKTSLIRPLHTLYLGMEKADGGDLGVRVDPQYNDEIGFLSRSFNQMLQSIQKAERNFQTLADNAQDAILILEKNDIPIYANRRFGEIAGFESRELEHIRFSELVGREETTDAGTTTETSNEEKRTSGHRETAIQTKSGKQVPVELTVFETLWHGKPSTVAVLRDITERKRADELAQQQLERLMLMDKLNSLGLLAATVAHEVKSPNQTILYNAETLRGACPGVLSILNHYEEKKEALINGMTVEEFIETYPGLIEDIEECSRRIGGMVKQLSNYPEDDAALPPVSLDVNEVIRTALRLLKNYLKRATDNFVLRQEKDLPNIRGKARKLEQVVINLIINACQALPSREKRIIVSSSHDRVRRTVVVSVQDEGTGIPSEIIERIKEPFFTTKQSIGGTGLGLFVADKIVGEHNGDLRIESSPGKGTTAVISFPVEERK